MTDTTAAYPPFTHPIPTELQGTLPQTILVADVCRALVAAGIPERNVAIAFAAAKVEHLGDHRVVWVRPEVGIELFRPVLKFEYAVLPGSLIMVPAVTVYRRVADGQEHLLLTVWATAVTGYCWSSRPNNPAELHSVHHADGRDTLVVAITDARRAQPRGF